MSPRRSAQASGPAITLAAMRQRCAARSVSLTGPRLAVIRTVLALQGTHPTADEIHMAAKTSGVDVGRATVYRTLEAFVENGILTKASHTGTAVRYDAVVAQHHHLVCLRCDGILDITDEELDAVRVPDTSNLGFAVSDVQVQLRGHCRSCQKLKKEDHS